MKKSYLIECIVDRQGLTDGGYLSQNGKEFRGILYAKFYNSKKEAEDNIAKAANLARVVKIIEVWVR